MEVKNVENLSRTSLEFCCQIIKLKNKAGQKFHLNCQNGILGSRISLVLDQWQKRQNPSWVHITLSQYFDCRILIKKNIAYKSVKYKFSPSFSNHLLLWNVFYLNFITTILLVWFRLNFGSHSVKGDTNNGSILRKKRSKVQMRDTSQIQPSRIKLDRLRTFKNIFFNYIYVLLSN